MDDKIVRRVDETAQELFDFLRQLVECNSYTRNPEGLARNAALIMNKGLENGIEFDRVDMDHGPLRFPHLYYSNTRQEPFFAMAGHFDTVHPPEEGFLHLADEGERLVGPGVNDMKGGVVVSLFALIVLNGLGLGEEIPVRVIYNADEEIGSPTSRKMISEKFGGAAAAFVFEAGRLPGDRILTSRKGAMVLELDFKGRPAHAGESPGQGVNAIMEACRKLLELDQCNNGSGTATVSVGTISGGTSKNVVPARCKAVVDIRIATREAGRQLQKKIETILGKPCLPDAEIEYTLDLHRPPFVRSAKMAPYIALYSETARELGLDISEGSSGGVSDANNISALGIPTLDGLGPVGARPHSHAEFAIKQSLIDRTKVFSLFLYRLAKQKRRQT